MKRYQLIIDFTHLDLMLEDLNAGHMKMLETHSDTKYLSLI